MFSVEELCMIREAIQSHVDFNSYISLQSLYKFEELNVKVSEILLDWKSK